MKEEPFQGAQGCHKKSGKDKELAQEARHYPGAEETYGASSHGSAFAQAPASVLRDGDPGSS